jgi:hypothetical protein
MVTTKFLMSGGWGTRALMLRGEGRGKPKLAIMIYVTY